MINIKKMIFKVTHQFYDKNFIKLYNEFQKNQWKNLDELVIKQENQLKSIINFSYYHVPFYKKLLDKLDIGPNEIKTIDDLRFIPILTKKIIKENWSDFIPNNINKIKNMEVSTGGTTGVPLRYRISKNQRTRLLVTFYTGLGFAGYKLSDKILYFGGTSIGVGKEYNFFKALQNYSRNIIGLSAYDLDNNKLSMYVNRINLEKPVFIRSFPSAIYFLAKWIKNNNIKIIYPKGIFTTSEKLYHDMRLLIENVFQCKVFDNYGLHDGALSAYECSHHHGMHIFTENSIFEVISNNKRLSDGEGKAIATSLYNNAFPFIRYDTGDIVKITDKLCTCGRKTNLITEIISRSVDFFITPDNRYIHGWFFYLLMYSNSVGIDKYQIVQKDYHLININLIVNNDFKIETSLNIIKSIKEKENNWNVVINYVDSIEPTKAGKYKFIINEILQDD